MRLAAVLVLFVLPAGQLESIVNSDPQVDLIFADYSKSDSPGCAIGVIRNGNFVYRKAYGMGSLELGVPLSSQSVFYMGSASKQFTAASVVLAAEQGFLSLDDNVRKYIPELPDYGQPITLLDMLHQTSGLSDVLAMLWISGRNSEDVHPTAELMDLIVRQKALNFKPGSEFMYSNTNYFLLAEVVKRATKKSLAQFAADNIFRPLGMTHTLFYDDHTTVVRGRVAAYRARKNGDFVLDWSTNYDMVGGGGLMSTVDDLLLWDQNFYQHKLGRGTLINEMQTPGVLDSGAHTNYGLGLYLTTYRGLPIVEHPGALFGYGTEILRFPQQRFTVITLCNAAGADPVRLARKVADVYLEKELHPLPVVVPSNDSDVASFAGKYYDDGRHFLVSFTTADGKLVLQGSSLDRVEPNRFEDPVIGGVVNFSNIGGRKKATVVYNGTTTFEGTVIDDDLRLDEPALSAYAGVFKNAELGASYRFSVEDGNLMLRMNWNSAIRLQPAVPDEFTSGEMTFVFGRDSGKRISRVSVFAGWNGVVRNFLLEKIN